MGFESPIPNGSGPVRSLVDLPGPKSLKAGEPPERRTALLLIVGRSAPNEGWTRVIEASPFACRADDRFRRNWASPSDRLQRTNLERPSWFVYGKV